MKSRFERYKTAAIEMRKKGLSYGEIKKGLSVDIPKSTLGCWFKNLELSNEAKGFLNFLTLDKLRQNRLFSVQKKESEKKEYFVRLEKEMKKMLPYLRNKDIAKISLATLYFGGGTKKRRGSMVFGSSNPKNVSLYLKLLRFCYNIDEDKLRCTIQCRNGQDIEDLENFWGNVTQIEKSRFYKTQIDPRTIGKEMKNSEYKGVCRIDCFSVEIFDELNALMNVVCDI